MPGTNGTVLGNVERDSILASLRPDGTRAGLGVRPPVGIIASADGVGVTIADIIHRARPATNQSGRIRVRGAAELGMMAARVVHHELFVRDARDRGLDKEPEMARRLRLAAASRPSSECDVCNLCVSCSQSAARPSTRFSATTVCRARYTAGSISPPACAAR